MRVLVVEDEPLLAEVIRDGLRLEAIAADVAGNGDTALDVAAAGAAPSLGSVGDALTARWPKARSGCPARSRPTG